MIAPRSVLLLVAGLVLLAAAIAVVVLGYGGSGDFPFGIHIITIPAVALLGLVAGWVMRDRQAAEERARAEIEARRKG